MHKRFEDIGIELVPGYAFGAFSGEAVFEWDDTELEWSCSFIRVDGSDGVDAEGKPAAVGLIRGGHSDLYGKLFRMLEPQLLRRFEDEAWFQQPIREVERRDCGYGHQQHERV